MSSVITELFTNQTTNASTASFNCSPVDNQTDAIRGLQIIGVSDGEALGLEQFNAAETDESDSANWSEILLTNPLAVGQFFPISNAPDILKFRVTMSGAGASTDITINLLKQAK